MSTNTKTNTNENTQAQKIHKTNTICVRKGNPHSITDAGGSVPC